MRRFASWLVVAGVAAFGIGTIDPRWFVMPSRYEFTSSHPDWPWLLLGIPLIFAGLIILGTSIGRSSQSQNAHPQRAGNVGGTSRKPRAAPESVRQEIMEAQTYTPCTARALPNTHAASKPQPGQQREEQGDGHCPLCGKMRYMSTPKLLYGHWVCTKCHTGFASRRQWAYILDTLALVLFCIPLAAVFWTVMLAMGVSEQVIEARSRAIYALVLLVFCFKDGFAGHSFGKLLCGVRVIHQRNGRPIGFPESFKRNLPLGAIPFLPILVAFDLKKGYRIGDGWAKSKVIWKKYEDHPIFAPDGRVGKSAPAPASTTDRPQVNTAAEFARVEAEDNQTYRASTFAAQWGPRIGFAICQAVVVLFHWITSAVVFVDEWPGWYMRRRNAAFLSIPGARPTNMGIPAQRA